MDKLGVYRPKNCFIFYFFYSGIAILLARNDKWILQNRQPLNFTIFQLRVSSSLRPKRFAKPLIKMCVYIPVYLHAYICTQITSSAFVQLLLEFTSGWSSVLHIVAYINVDFVFFPLHHTVRIHIAYV